MPYRPLTRMLGLCCLCGLFAALPALAADAMIKLDPAAFQLQGVHAQQAQYQGSPALKVSLLPTAAKTYQPDGAPNFAWLPMDFQDGTVEVEMAGTVAADAPKMARGFIGVAFRIGDKQAEVIYLRPTNGRADDQLRRNHTTQYYSYPDYSFFRLRKEAPGQYESYVDVVPGAWTKVRIEVEKAHARLFVNGADQPCLVINDLKLGPDARGGVGLWVDLGTEGYFRNMRITPQRR